MAAARARHPSTRSRRDAAFAMLDRGREGGWMTTTPDKFKPKERRKASRGKRVSVSEEERRAYEETVKRIGDREREHGQFLPEDVKRRR